MASMMDLAQSFDMAWRIEKAKTGRSSCRVCGQTIPKDEHRFGNEATLGATWYHLGCAKEGKPRAFKPFEARAAQLMGKAGPKPTKKKATPARNDELVARLVANPDDATRGVYADWLQTRGDPLGEYIALVLAGDEAAAKKVFQRNKAAFTGGFAARMLEWDKGLISALKLPLRAKPALVKSMLEKVFALSSGVLVRNVRIPTKPDASLVTYLSTQLPASVTNLFVYVTRELASIALPHVRHLELWATDMTADLATWVSLFAATGLPEVTALSIHGGAGDGDGSFSAQIAEAFLDSQLVRQLDYLEISQRSFVEEAEALVTARKTKLAHVTALAIEGLDEVFPEQTKAFESYAASMRPATS